MAALERAGALELFPAPMGTFAGRIADARLSAPPGRGAGRRPAGRAPALGPAEGDRRVRHRQRCRRAVLLRYFSDEPSGCRPTGAATSRSGRRACAEPSTPRPLLPPTSTARDGAGAVDETAGRVGRTRHRPDPARLVGPGARAAGHDALEHGALPALRQRRARRGRPAIGSGALEKTEAPTRSCGGREACRPPPPETPSCAPRSGPRPPRADEGVPFLVRVLAAAEEPEQRALAARRSERRRRRAAAALRAAAPDHDADVAEAVRVALAGP